MLIKTFTPSRLSISLFALFLWGALCIALPSISYAANSHTIANGASKQIDEHGTCKKITNSSGKSVMVPTKSPAEWSSFRSSLPNGGVTKTNCIVYKGYFVSVSAPNGNFGGLAGANALCLSRLNASNWKGKATADYTNAAKVKAFLCTASGCQSPAPSTVFYFASTSSTSYGGSSFTTNASSRGPGNSANWSPASYFGYGGFIWTGRAVGSGTLWSTGTSGVNCSNWTTTGGTATPGYLADSTNQERWADANWAGGVYIACSKTNARLVCIVNP